ARRRQERTQSGMSCLRQGGMDRHAPAKPAQADGSSRGRGKKELRIQSLAGGYAAPASVAGAAHLRDLRHFLFILVGFRASRVARLRVDRRSQLRKLLVSELLLAQALGQKARLLAPAHDLGPGLQAAVGADLVMLDLLGGGD